MRNLNFFYSSAVYVPWTVKSVLRPGGAVRGEKLSEKVLEGAE